MACFQNFSRNPEFQTNSALLKGPNEPYKPTDKYITVEDQAEHQRDCDYPNEDNYESSGNFFKFKYLPQIPPKAGNYLITPPEA